MTLTSIINTMTEVVLLAVPWGFLFLLFYWNIYKLITESDNAEKRKQAVPRLVWSIVALAVVFSIGGIVNILSNTLLGSNNSTFAPTDSTPVTPFTPRTSPEDGPKTETPATPSGSSVSPGTSPFNPDINDPGFERVPPTSSDPNPIQNI
ncbi:MAG: hypothetical protein V4449_02100 [Patescibacteria group bacterium]